MTDEAAPPAPGETKPAEAPLAPTPVEPATPPAAPSWKPNYFFLGGVAIVSLIADLGTKAWAKARLEEPKSFDERRIQVIADHFNFVFAKNRGGAWGLLSDESETIRRPFFLGISVLAIIFIVSLYRRLTPQQTALKWGLPLVLGGALGNLVNRIQYNYVVDFIDIYVKGHHWPTFNVADIAICVGVGLMAVDMFQSRTPATPKAPESSPAPSVDAPSPPEASPPAAPKET